jgi:hypothetical protein
VGNHVTSIRASSDRRRSRGTRRVHRRRVEPGEGRRQEAARRQESGDREGADSPPCLLHVPRVRVAVRGMGLPVGRGSPPAPGRAEPAGSRRRSLPPSRKLKLPVSTVAESITMTLLWAMACFESIWIGIPVLNRVGR